MPSMKAPLRIPATRGKDAWPLLCIFPGDHRDNWVKCGGKHDNFRLQIGDTFFTRPGERRSFLSAAELGRVLAKRIADVFGVCLGDTPDGTVTVNLYLPQGAKVWLMRPHGLPVAELVAAPPYERDGEWVVLLRYSGQIVPVKQVRPRSESLAECTDDPAELKGGCRED